MLFDQWLDVVDLSYRQRIDQQHTAQKRKASTEGRIKLAVIQLITMGDRVSIRSVAKVANLSNPKVQTFISSKCIS